MWGTRIGYLLPFLPDGDLDHWLTHNALGSETADDFLRQIVTGLTAMHRAGWWHGDLSARNVLMSRTGGTPSGWRLRISDPMAIAARERPASAIDVAQLIVMARRLRNSATPSREN